MQACALVLAADGYALEFQSPTLISAKSHRVDDAKRAASVVGGVAAAPFALVGDLVLLMASNGRGTPPLTMMSIGTAVKGGKYDIQMNVQAEELTPERTALRTTCVVNGRVRPQSDWLKAFWTGVGARVRVLDPSEAARAALPMATMPVGHQHAGGPTERSGATGHEAPAARKPAPAVSQRSVPAAPIPAPAPPAPPPSGDRPWGDLLEPAPGDDPRNGAPPRR